MKNLRFTIGLLTIALVVFVAGCSKPGYIVYIDNTWCQALTWDGDKIDELWVFPGDDVTWVNTSDKELTIVFQDETVFGVKEVDIKIAGRAQLTVKLETRGGVDYVINPCDGEQGTPRVSVGDPP